MITAPANRLKAAFFLNKTPMGHIAHLSNNSHNKISFMKLYTKHLSNVVEKILDKKLIRKIRFSNGRLTLHPGIMI